MRMSHVYQPVMIRNLLKNKGTADSAKIAKDLLAYDVSQVEYYQLITKNMVGKVLPITEASQIKMEIAISSMVLRI